MTYQYRIKYRQMTSRARRVEVGIIDEAYHREAMRRLCQIADEMEEDGHLVHEITLKPFFSNPSNPE